MCTTCGGGAVWLVLTRRYSSRPLRPASLASSARPRLRRLRIDGVDEGIGDQPHSAVGNYGGETIAADPPPPGERRAGAEPGGCPRIPPFGYWVSFNGRP